MVSDNDTLGPYRRERDFDRTSEPSRGEPSRWPLIKMDDEAADARRNPTSTENRSVKTGRTMHQIAKVGEEDS